MSPKEAENPDQNPDQNSDQNRPAQNDNNNNIIDDDANQQQNQPADNNGAQDGPTQNGAQSKCFDLPRTFLCTFLLNRYRNQAGYFYSIQKPK